MGAALAFQVANPELVVLGLGYRDYPEDELWARAEKMLQPRYKVSRDSPLPLAFFVPYGTKVS
jgi:hypothetical protein